MPKASRCSCQLGKPYISLVSAKVSGALSARGLHGLKMITSDNHAGLKAAWQSVFPSVLWQRCQFHLQQNASAHIPKKSMEKEAHEDIKSIFNMPSREEAEYMLKKTVEKYAPRASEFAE